MQKPANQKTSIQNRFIDWMLMLFGLLLILFYVVMATSPFWFVNKDQKMMFIPLFPFLIFGLQCLMKPKKLWAWLYSRTKKHSATATILWVTGGVFVETAMTYNDLKHIFLILIFAISLLIISAYLFVGKAK